MRDLRDERRDQGPDARERARRDDRRTRRAADAPRTDRRPEERRETDQGTDLDERERQVRTSRVGERPFG
ncbi:hypothetical protein [Streptomyces carpinensis]|uniref:hypothetical protein n=1 Tax=Streptomyces carpinensis TaxID=66369 RepID=UPI000A3C1197|nr:hypothetical protein [Streptomyces carpinensis]